MLNQLNMSGMTKVESAIERLKRYEPEDGYFLAFSGGKDSVTIKALADMAGVKYDAHYQITSVDPPELVEFVKTFPDVSMDFPRYKDGSVVTMWNLIPKKRMPPTRVARYCCEFLKESATGTRFGVTGVRWSESSKRQQNRGGLELKKYFSHRALKLDPDVDHDTSGWKYRCLNPIIDWSADDVWEFIRTYNVRYCGLYDEGFKRLGCVGCPMAKQEPEFERWPKIKMAYVKAFDRMLQKRIEDGLPQDNWETGQDVMDWWVKNQK